MLGRWVGRSGRPDVAAVPQHAAGVIVRPRRGIIHGGSRGITQGVGRHGRVGVVPVLLRFRHNAVDRGGSDAAVDSGHDLSQWKTVGHRAPEDEIVERHVTHVRGSIILVVDCLSRLRSGCQWSSPQEGVGRIAQGIVRALDAGAVANLVAHVEVDVVIQEGFRREDDVVAIVLEVPDDLGIADVRPVVHVSRL